MSNAAQVVMQSLYFKHQVEDKPDVRINMSMDAFYFGHCVLNPLECMRLMCFDDGMSIYEEDAARLCGVDVGAFSDKVPPLTLEDAERAMGRLALIYLASLRNEWRAEGGGDLESVLSAPEAFRLMIGANNKAKAQ